MRRAVAPADHSLAVCGGNNKKTLDRASLTLGTGLGSWQRLGRAGSPDGAIHPSLSGSTPERSTPIIAGLSIGALK